MGALRLADISGSILCLALLALHANPFTASRFLLVLVVGGAAFQVLRPRTRRAGVLTGVAALSGVLLIYPLLNYFRYGDGEYLSGWAALSSPDFDGFQQVANAVSYVETHGIAWGNFSLSGIFYFVPRSIWPGKAVPASVEVAIDRGYNFTNLSMPIHAEFYLDFGLVGAIVVMFALGFWIGKIDFGWLHSDYSRSIVLAPVVAVAMLGVIRGPIGAAAPIYLSVLVPLFFGTKVVATTKLERARRPRVPREEHQRAPSSRGRNAIGSRDSG